MGSYLSESTASQGGTESPHSKERLLSNEKSSWTAARMPLSSRRTESLRTLSVSRCLGEQRAQIAEGPGPAGDGRRGTFCRGSARTGLLVSPGTLPETVTITLPHNRFFVAPSTPSTIGTFVRVHLEFHLRVPELTGNASLYIRFGLSTAASCGAVVACW